MRRVGVHHAHPFNPVGMRQLAQQMRQRILPAKVLSVARRILRHEYQFLHTFFSKLVCFRNDRTESPAAKMAAHLRNETECARAVAAFGDLDEGIVAWRSQHARRRFVVQIRRALIAKGDDWK